jgi:hypothetical protein
MYDRGVASIENLVGVETDGIGNGEASLSASTVMDRSSFITIPDAVDWRSRSRDPASAFNSMSNLTLGMAMHTLGDTMHTDRC